MMMHEVKFILFCVLGIPFLALLFFSSLGTAFYLLNSYFKWLGLVQ